MRTTLRTLAAVLAVAFVTTVVAELGARALARRSWHLTPRRARAERAAFLASIPLGKPDADAAAGSRRRYVDMAYGARYELHPYFGHTFFRGVAPANNNGFFADVDYPYARREHELVVGVFGGSVAMQVAAAGDALAASLAPALRERGYDRVKVLSFAVGAWRQPQIFNALIYYLDTVDVVIELDGFNETIQLIPAQLRAYPASYPASDVFRPLASASSSPYETARLGKALLAHENAAYVTRALDGSMLRRSMLAHLVWRAYADRYRATVAALRVTTDAGADEWGGVEPGEASERIARYLRLYGRLVRDAALASAAEGKPYFHFVQPNQHPRGAKPLTDEERERFLTPPWVDVLTPYYAELATMSHTLAAAGIDSTYLGDLFAHASETLYADACCHLNERGTALLVQAIADHVLASGALATIPPPSRGDPASDEPKRVSSAR